MITEEEKGIIKKLSEKYQVKKVLLFGSCLDNAKNNRDIDIAIEGINADNFFEYYGDLLLNLTKPVDVVDMSGSSKFIELIKQEGELLYEQI
jgi:uncharacterized protein